MDSQEFHDALYRERCRREAVENDNRRLRRLLEKTRDEFMGLPHSLGYEFTHLPEIEAELKKAPNAKVTGSPALSASPRELPGYATEVKK